MTKILRQPDPTRANLEQELAVATEKLIDLTLRYIDRVERRRLPKATYDKEIVSAALKHVARELYQRDVRVSFNAPQAGEPLRFTVECDRRASRLNVAYPPGRSPLIEPT